MARSCTLIRTQDFCPSSFYRVFIEFRAKRVYFLSNDFLKTKVNSARFAREQTRNRSKISLWLSVRWGKMTGIFSKAHKGPPSAIPSSSSHIPKIILSSHRRHARFFEHFSDRVLHILSDIGSSFPKGERHVICLAMTVEMSLKVWHGESKSLHPP